MSIAHTLDALRAHREARGHLPEGEVLGNLLERLAAHYPEELLAVLLTYDDDTPDR